MRWNGIWGYAEVATWLVLILGVGRPSYADDRRDKCGDHKDPVVAMCMALDREEWRLRVVSVASGYKLDWANLFDGGGMGSRWDTIAEWLQRRECDGLRSLIWVGPETALQCREPPAEVVQQVAQWAKGRGVRVSYEGWGHPPVKW